MEWTPSCWVLSVSLTAVVAITQTPRPSSVSSVQMDAENAQTMQPTALDVQLTKNCTEPNAWMFVLLIPQLKTPQESAKIVNHHVPNVLPS